VLQLKALGVAKPEAFDFLSKPPKGALVRALETLFAVGALNEGGALTARGRRLAKLPLPPVLAAAVDRRKPASVFSTRVEGEFYAPRVLGARRGRLPRRASRATHLGAATDPEARPGAPDVLLVAALVVASEHGIFARRGVW